MVFFELPLLFVRAFCSPGSFFRHAQEDNPEIFVVADHACPLRDMRRIFGPSCLPKKHLLLCELSNDATAILL